jgi:hypothetical protein
MDPTLFATVVIVRVLMFLDVVISDITILFLIVMPKRWMLVAMMKLK